MNIDEMIFVLYMNYIVRYIINLYPYFMSGSW